jgi:hypothetical protein
MRDLSTADYAHATAVCVNFALSSAEAKVREELETAVGECAEALRRVLRVLQQQRVETPSLSTVAGQLH